MAAVSVKRSIGIKQCVVDQTTMAPKRGNWVKRERERENNIILSLAFTQERA